MTESRLKVFLNFNRERHYSLINHNLMENKWSATLINRMPGIALKPTFLLHCNEAFCRQKHSKVLFFLSHLFHTTTLAVTEKSVGISNARQRRT